MGIVAAQLTAQVNVSGAKEAEAQLLGMSKATQATAVNLGTLAAGGVVLAGAALVGLGAKAVQMAGDFQAGMTSLVTGAGESQKNIQMVSQGILKMAVDTGTSTKQLTDGMYMIESAGFHGAAGLQILQAAAEGAKVGNANLADVANGVTTAMTDYASTGLTASQATNTLIATVAAGKTHMQDLASAMSTILPTSAAVHVSFLDTSAALATMTGEGTDAASAATYLRQLLMALEAPASKGAKALQEIGLSTADVAAEMKVSLPGTLQLITDHLKQKFPEGSAAYVAALKDIAGGSKQMQGILQLTGTHLQVFKDNVAGISDAVKKGGSGITGWSEVQGNFNQKLDQAKAAVEVLMIKIGTGLLPILGQILGAITPVIMQFTTWITTGNRLKEFLDNSSPGMIALKIAIVALAGAIGGVMVFALYSMAAAAVTALIAMWPILAIGAAVALVIAGIVLAVTHWGDITKWLGGIWQGFLTWLQGAWSAFSGWFMGLLKSIGTFLFDAIAGPLGPLVIFLVQHWQQIWSATQATFGPMVSFIGAVFGTIANIIAALLRPLVLWISDRLTEIRLAWQLAWNLIYTNVFTWLTNTGLFIIQKIQWVKDTLYYIWNLIKTDVNAVFMWIALTVATKAIEIGDNILKPFNSARDAIAGILKTFANNMIGMLNNGISAVESFVNFFGQGLDTIAEKLGTKGLIPTVHFGRIPTYASGTDYHPGGPAVVGERGRELVMLPRGASVLPNSQTEALLSLFGGSTPGYASGIGDALGNFFSWIGQGAETVLNNVMGALHITSPKLPGVLDEIASGLLDTVKKWAVSWLGGILPQAGGGGSGSALAVNVPGNLASWIAAALALTGAPGNWASDLAVIAMHESGGNPNSINNWDINAQEGHPSQGIMQMIPSTFAAHMLAGHTNILNPIDNIASAIGYIVSRYGSVFNVPGIVSMSQGGPYVGYADGTSFASGGYAWVGERGRELMYVPRGASIIPNNQISGGGGGSSAQQITVNPPPIYLDGRELATGLMPYIVDAIRYRVGTVGI